MKLHHLRMAVAMILVTSGAVEGHGYPQGAQRSDTRSGRGAKIPAGFHQIASVEVSGDKKCVVGNVQDEDWTYSHAYVYLSGEVGKGSQWVRRLDIPEEFFGGRATHCLYSGEFLYVLLQLDTYAAVSMNQGIVHVVKLDLEGGAVLAETPISIAEATQNYSAWVRRGESFRQEGDQIRVSGMYRYLHLDEAEDHPFSVTVKM